MQKIKEILPGFIVCLILGLIGKFIGGIFPTIGGATFAIFLGILMGNTIFNKKKFERGSKFSESELLAYSIVLMGGTLNLTDIISVGINGVVFIAIQMTGTVLMAYFIGRKLGFSKKFSLLMSSGNAVCGSSAIAATAPVIDAEGVEKGISITMVNVIGTILMFLLPVIATFLYKQETVHTSALIGGVLQSVGQVIAAAKFINDDVVQLATIFKIIRIIFLVVVVIVYSRIDLKDECTKSFKVKKKINISVPWFIIGFFILSIIHSLGLISSNVSSTFKMISGNFEIIALAAIGMRVKIVDLLREGPKAMLYGLLIASVQIVLALTLIKIFIG